MLPVCSISTQPQASWIMAATDMVLPSYWQSKGVYILVNQMLCIQWPIIVFVGWNIYSCLHRDLLETKTSKKYWNFDYYSTVYTCPPPPPSTHTGSSINEYISWFSGPADWGPLPPPHYSLIISLFLTYVREVAREAHDYSTTWPVRGNL